MVTTGALGACTDGTPTLPDPVPEGTFVLSTCTYGAPATPLSPPCANGRNAKWTDYIDSARVTFLNGHGSWSQWSKRAYNYAFQPGDTPPPTEYSVASVDTTFTVLSDSVRFGSANGNVSLGWYTPTELRWQNGSQFLGVFA